MSSPIINVFELKSDRVRTLHLAWIAFFISFVVWFNHAPLLAAIKTSLDLTGQQIKALLILNVALTIPSRVLIGIAVDRYGPRFVYGNLLIVGALICFGFALSRSFVQLALFRLLLGFVGAGFVIGIRLVGEWFPAKQVGMAEGIYGGWGNFGSAAAAMTLPSIALLFAPENGWRVAIAGTGVAALVYGVFFLWRARNTPKGATYFKPKKHGGLEVSSKQDYYFYLAMNVPMYGALIMLIWKLASGQVALISSSAAVILTLGLGAVYLIQTRSIKRVNKDVLDGARSPLLRYKFRQVAILDMAYLVTFGSELAVVSMLPLFFMEVFRLEAVEAGLLASGFAVMNLVARPGGGLLSDKLGRRRTLLVLIAGLALGYFVLSGIHGGWPLGLAVLATMACSFFVQAGEGAVFAMVPLIQRRMTGQIAGMVGAFGNVGAVFFLTVLSFVDYSTFFMVIGASAIVSLGCAYFLSEPEGAVAELDDNGNVQLIEVA